MTVDKYPLFVGRQQQIDRLMQAATADDGRSRVVLLDGQGGIGKTWLLQEIEKRLRNSHVPHTKLIDMDDTSFHLASYFSRTIVEDLGAEAFSSYLSASEPYEVEARPQIDLMRVLGYLEKSVYAFIEDLNRLTEQTRVTILIDTFEEVQDTNKDLWTFLHRMIKELKNTTFIIAGRRVNELPKKLKDSDVKAELMALAGLADAEIDEFFAAAANLNDEQKRKLALLTNGNPLLLCLALDCYRYGYWLDDLDNKPLLELEELLAEESDEAKRLRYEFERSLVVAYADAEPFRYFIRQLAHASRRINKEIFQTLIRFASNAEAEAWWTELQTLPYIRKRAAGDYISVHDVLREFIFTYVIPVRDPDFSERQQINEKLIACYANILAEAQRNLQKRKAEFTEAARRQDKPVEPRQSMTADDLAYLFTQIDALESKIWILQAEALHYQLIADLETGIESFVRQFDEAMTRRQFILRQRVAYEIKQWLAEGFIRAGTTEYLEISRRLADQEVEAGQAEEAVGRVNHLLDLYVEPAQRLQLLELRAGCKLGLENGAAKAIQDYKLALNLVRKLKRSAVDCARLEKQLGWCYRQLGNWDRASFWYEKAQDHLAKPSAMDPLTIKELASLYTNAAYIEALRGDFPRAMDLGQRGLQHRATLNLKREQGMSYSTIGEICRYNRNFAEALASYQKAEEIFYELDDREWLGRLWQQEAICILQMGGNLQQALEKIKQAIDYCVRYNHRALSSAYNRAGRIIAKVPDLSVDDRLNQSLFYFRIGIERALDVGDIWFFLANCVEALEMVKCEYESTKKYKLLKLIHEFDVRIAEKIVKKPSKSQRKSSAYFPDLLGRRELVLGTLDYLEGLDLPDHADKFDHALQHYLQGFRLITRSFFGSYGLLRMTGELNDLAARVVQLPPKIARRWRNSFVNQWRGKGIHPTLKSFAGRIDELLSIREQAPSQEHLKRVA